MNDIINKLLIRSLSAKMLPKTRLWLIKKAHDGKGGCKKRKYFYSHVRLKVELISHQLNYPHTSDIISIQRT